MEKFFYDDYKKWMIQEFFFFQVFFCLFVSLFIIFYRKYISIKSVFNVWRVHSSDSKMNYYKKVQKRMKDDVDGDCISFNLYRNTESSMNVLKKMERRFQKRGVLPDLWTMFLQRRVTSNWVVDQWTTKQWKSLWNKNWR